MFDVLAKIMVLDRVLVLRNLFAHLIGLVEKKVFIKFGVHFSKTINIANT